VIVRVFIHSRDKFVGCLNQEPFARANFAYRALRSVSSRVQAASLVIGFHRVVTLAYARQDPAQVCLARGAVGANSQFLAIRLLGKLQVARFGVAPGELMLRLGTLRIEPDALLGGLQCLSVLSQVFQGAGQVRVVFGMLWTELDGRAK